MANRIISDLIGTLKTFFRIGNVRLKNNSAVIEARNDGDSAYIPLASSRINLKGAAGGTGLIPNAAANFDLTLPAADAAGSSNDYALVSDGSGQLSFVQVATGANAVKKQSEVIAFNTASPAVVFTPPANATIQQIIVDVETVFDSAAPQLSVGVTGDTGRYMAAAENNLKVQASYETNPEYEEDGTPEEIIVTLVPDTATAGSARVTVVYANPA